MIPALALQLGAKRIDPEGPGGIAPRVLAEPVRGAEPEAALELRIPLRAALLEHAVERQLETAVIGVMAGTPVADPDGPRVGRLRRGEDQLDAGVAPVAGDGTLPKVLRRRKAAVVFDQVGVALSVGLEEPAYDAQAGALRVEVLLGAGLGQRADNPFHVPFVAVKQEADERLLVVRVAAGVCLNQD